MYCFRFYDAKIECVNFVYVHVVPNHNGIIKKSGGQLSYQSIEVMIAISKFEQCILLKQQ